MSEWLLLNICTGSTYVQNRFATLTVQSGESILYICYGPVHMLSEPVHMLNRPYTVKLQGPVQYYLSIMVYSLVFSVWAMVIILVVPFSTFTLIIQEGCM